MATRIKLRRDTSANWTSVNPILANGEMGVEADTRRVKIGDGATKWTALDYAIAGDLKVSGKTVSTEMGVSIANQDPETWLNTIKAKANWAGINGIAYDSTGNLYVSGWEEYGYDGNGSGSSDSFLIKFDSQGAVVWSKYVKLESYTYGGGVVVDSKDNVAVMAIDDDTYIWSVTKLDSDGDVVWQKTYDDASTVSTGVNLVVDSRDDFIVVGNRTDETQDNHVGLFAVKISGYNGEVVWQTTYGTSQNNIDHPCVAVDGDGNTIIAGNLYYNGGNKALIAKISSTGAPVWCNTFSNSENNWSNYDMYVGSLDSDDDGNIYFVGSYVVPDYVQDLNNNTFDGRASLVMKLDSDGIPQWSRLMGPGDCNDMGAQATYHNGRLYAMFQTEKAYYKKDIYLNQNSPYGGYTTQEIVVACYDANNGAVLWANNFGPELLWNYASPSGNPSNWQDTSSYQGRYIAVRGDYVVIGGQSGTYSRADDEETRSFGWVAQLPADGTLMDLDGWSLRPSKSASKYAQIKHENWQLMYQSNNDDIVTTDANESTEDTSDYIRINLTSSGANTWDFKPNGDLALPVDGNLELSRSKQGEINVVGYFNEDNTDNVWDWYTSVTVDPEGNKYYAGQWNVLDNNNSRGDGEMPLVVKVNKAGEVEWKIILSNFDMYDHNSYSIYGQSNGIAYDPSTGNIVVVATDSSEGNAEQMLVVDINTANGKVVQSKRFRNNNGDDMDTAHINIDAAGYRYITGTVYGDNYITFTATNALVASDAVDTLMFPKSVFDGHVSPSSRQAFDWQINWDGWYDVQEIDRYNDVATVLRQGEGLEITVSASAGSSATLDATTLTTWGYFAWNDHTLDSFTSVDTSPWMVLQPGMQCTFNGDPGLGTFTVVSNTTSPTSGAGYVHITFDNALGAWVNITSITYTSAGSYSVDSIDNGGTHYLTGHEIKVLGTDLGGATPANDLILRVENYDTGGVVNNLSVVSGTPAGSGTYGLSGLPNYNVGSGATFDVQVNSETGFQTVYLNQGGTNYVVNDVVTIPGTLLGGGSGANIVITVSDVGYSLGNVSSGEGSGYSVTTRGTNPLTHVRMKFGYDSNFTSGGPWTLRHYTDYNSFVTKLQPAGSTATNAIVWAKWIDKSGEDKGVATDYDSDGNVYWISRTADTYNSTNDSVDDRTNVTKLNSDGELQWMKTYNYDGNEGLPSGIQVDSEDKIVISQDHWASYNNTWYPVISRLLPNGDVLWTKRINADGSEGWNSSGLALDNDDNIYYTVNRYDGDNNAQWFVKLDIKDGFQIWQHDIRIEGNDLTPSWNWDVDITGNKLAVSGNQYHFAGFTQDPDGGEGVAVGATLPSDGSAIDTAVGPFYVDSTYYGSEGGYDEPVDRTHVVANWTGLVEVTDRDPIQSWTEHSPVNNYPVYVNSGAGITFADGSVQTTSAANLPQIRHAGDGFWYKFKLSDAGKHLYFRNGDNTVIVPSYSEVQFEVGTVLTIVNNSGGNVYVGMDPATMYNGTFKLPQLNTGVNSNEYQPSGAYGYDQGGGQVITLLKVGEDKNDGSVWVVQFQGGDFWTWND